MGNRKGAFTGIEQLHRTMTKHGIDPATTTLMTDIATNITIHQIHAYTRNNEQKTVLAATRGNDLLHFSVHDSWNGFIRSRESLMFRFVDYYAVVYFTDGSCCTTPIPEDTPAWELEDMALSTFLGKGSIYAK